MSDLSSRIAQNVAEVRDRIAEAAGRAGRDAEEITLVAVSKYVGPEVARALVEAGCRTLGESRPQHLEEMAQSLDDPAIDWHMIGQLQRNKVRRTLPLVKMIESVDSPRLAGAIDRIAGELSLRVPILLEVNVSGEQSKHGFEPDEVEPYLEDLARLKNVEPRGLMCMAGLAGGPDDAARDFAQLFQLREELRANCPPGVVLDELSMGMSGDYEAAIAEGSTIVRVGTALMSGVPR